MIYAARHNDRVIKQMILNIFDNLILRYAYMFSRKFPEIRLEDIKQTAYERAIICIQKFKPLPNTFSFPAYLKVALYFGLRRFCCKNLTTISYNEKTIEKKMKRVEFPNEGDR